MRIKLSFDDATLPDIRVAEIISKYGLNKNTIFFFPVMPSLANRPKGRTSLNERQMQEIANNFEIGSHTITHRLLTRISPEEARQEIFESREILQQKFNQSIDQFSYPRGYANPEIELMVSKAGYKGARGVTVGFLHESENAYFEQNTVHVGYDRAEYAGKTWFEYALSMLEIGRGNNESVFSIFGHGWELEKYPQGMELFDELLDTLTKA